MKYSKLLCKNGDSFIATPHFFISIINQKINCYSKNKIKDYQFIKGVPNGKAIIILNNEKRIIIDDIIKGRVFDFLQYIHSKNFNKTSYDNTIRGQFPILLDIDHADVIDKLRNAMLNGIISSYEFDDFNPSYPKAGK